MGYIVGGVELILDEPVDDGALADCLVTDEHYFEFNGVLLVGGVADLVLTLIHNPSYKISETYSIIRISMEIYHISKYENIAERLRRLASNPNLNTNNSEQSQTYAYRHNQPAASHKKENQTFDADQRTKYGENLKYSKISTIETEGMSEDQEESYINERFIFKETPPNIPSK